MARVPLRSLNLGRLDSRASEAAFGAGRSIESFGGGAGPEAYGAGLEIPTADAGGYGANLARDISQVGEIVQGAAITALRVDQQDQILRGRRQALAAENDYNTRFMELQANAPADAKDFTKSTMEDFQTFRAERIKDLTGIERQTVEDQLTQLEGSIYRDSFKFEADRRFEARKSETRALLDIASNAVFSRPQDLARIRGGLLDDIDASDLPEFAKKALAGTATAALAETYFAAEVQRDPYGAQKRLTEGTDLQGLEVSSRLSLLNKADTEIRGIEAEQRRVENERQAQAAQRASLARQEQTLRLSALRNETQFAVQTIERGLTPASIGDLTKRIAAEGRAGAELAGALQLAEGTAGYARTFAVKPVAEQAAELEALRAQPQTPESFAKLQAAGKVLQATAEAVREGRGLNRAAELGIVELQPVDVTDPESLGARIQASQLAAGYLGAPVEVFTPAERAATAAALAKLPGEQKAAYLSQVQAAAGDAYPDVIRELGLKGGLDRGSRYISLLAGRPEAAQIANAVGEAMDTDEKDLKVNLTRAGVSEADVDRLVERELRGFVDTLGPTYAQGSDGGAQALITDITDMVKRTALVQMRTQSAKEAVQGAAEAIINSRYEFRDGFRIPRPSSGGQSAIARIDKMMLDTISSLSPEIVDPPGSMAGVDDATRRAGYVEAVRNRGQWATLPDESGLVLLDENGNAVMARGRPVMVKF